VTARNHGSRRLLFVLNHTALPQEVKLDRAYHNLLGEPTPLDGTLTLAPRDVLILEKAE